MEDDAFSVASSSFVLLDYVVFVAFLLISLLIGVYFGVQSFCRRRRSKTENSDDGSDDAIIGDSSPPKRKDSAQETNEFLLGNRNMPMLPVSLSILASFLSANTVMGVPGAFENFNILIPFDTLWIKFACAGP